jgi:lipase
MAARCFPGVAAVVRECSENHVTVNGVNLCWFEWGGEFRSAGTVLLIHATGFHARCWDQTIAHLGERHVIAVDMRGHGRSGKTPPYQWDVFGADVLAFVRALDLTDIVGAGHSMGGHSLTQAVARDASRYRRIVLVDPVILSPEAYAMYQPGPAEEHPVSRRRNLFDDARAMYDNLHGRGSFGLWRDEALHDYCEYGLLPNPEGPGYVLACPPLVEATIYTGSASRNIHDLVRTIDIPVTVLRAQQREEGSMQMDFSRSPTWPQLAESFPAGRDVYLPELTHFMPMQAPELVASYISGEAV